MHIHVTHTLLAAEALAAMQLSRAILRHHLARLYYFKHDVVYHSSGHVHARRIPIDDDI